MNRTLLALLGGLAVCGCGRGRAIAPLSGSVAFNDQPVKAGKVNIASGQGFAASAAITNGRFRFKTQYGEGVPPGPYKVSITPASMSDKEYLEVLAGRRPDSKPPDADIPAKYRDFATSDLRAEVKPGDDNQVHFEMQGEAAKPPATKQGDAAKVKGP
jgi:hypothetical protein